MKLRKQCAFFVAVVLFCSIALVSFSCEIGSNRLAGTRWETAHGTTVLEFGQTSFTRSGGGTLAGTYRINGDAVIFTFHGVWNQPSETTGSLIGDTLAVWGMRFQRVR